MVPFRCDTFGGAWPGTRARPLDRQYCRGRSRGLYRIVTIRSATITVLRDTNNIASGLGIAVKFAKLCVLYFPARFHHRLSMPPYLTGFLLFLPSRMALRPSPTTNPFHLFRAPDPEWHSTMSPSSPWRDRTRLWAGPSSLLHKQQLHPFASTARRGGAYCERQAFPNQSSNPGAPAGCRPPMPKFRIFFRRANPDPYSAGDILRLALWRRTPVVSAGTLKVRLVLPNAAHNDNR